MAAQAIVAASVLKEFRKPITIAFLALVILIVVVIIRFMRRDKRRAKQQVKAMEAELIFQAEKDKTVYQSAAATFGIDERSARICDQIGMTIAGAFGTGLFGNDNEEMIVAQLNRLAGVKTIRCADFFYKKYTKKSAPNIAFDSLSTLNAFEKNKIKEDIKAPLIAYAKLKGNPSRDVYF